MLRMILSAVTTSTPQVTPQVGELLQAMQGEMSREALHAGADQTDVSRRSHAIDGLNPRARPGHAVSHVACSPPHDLDWCSPS